MKPARYDDAFEMVNLRGRSTGLPMNIWIGPRGGARHAARIKVQMDRRVQFDFHNLAIIGVDPPEKLIDGMLSAWDLELVRRYIRLNRDAILDHWHERTDGAELTRMLRPLAQ